MTKLIPFSLNFKEIDNIVIKSPNIIDIVAKHKNIEIKLGRQYYLEKHIFCGSLNIDACLQDKFSSYF